MRIAARSDVGLVRVKNEDAYWYDSDRGIFVIADGLGGLQAGEIASTMAVQIISKRLTQAIDLSLTEDRLADEMYDSFRVASNEIFQRGSESEELQGMSCSVLAAIIQDEHCVIAHAGDTRAYLLYENTLHQITVDDTPVAAMVKRGYLLPEKARSHSMKNFLLKSLGNQTNVEANLSQFPVKSQERLLLCSDGLWAMVAKETIRDILLTEDPEIVCLELIGAARNQGGSDNITVMVIEIGDQAKSITPTDTTTEMPRTYL